MILETAERITQIDRLRLALEPSLELLRTLTLDEFGELHLGIPNNDIPHLSRLLPQATPDVVQTEWTGASGQVLLKQSISFINFLSANYANFSGQTLQAARILDFGCGWGRLLRLMTYFVDPAQLYGCDAWESSLQHARLARVSGTLARSDSRPATLPFGNATFDLIYSFSVFTHLPPDVTRICLSAFRKYISPNGLLVITLRPREYWQFSLRPRGISYNMLENDHDNKGYAFLPNSATSQDYGATSIAVDYLVRNCPDWQVLRYGITQVDGMQTFVCLKPI